MKNADIQKKIRNYFNNDKPNINDYKKIFDYIIEKNINNKANIKKLPLQIGDIIKTHSDIKKIKKFTNYNPKTNISTGIGKFIEWYKDYYKIT